MQIFCEFNILHLFGIVGFAKNRIVSILLRYHGFNSSVWKEIDVIYLIFFIVILKWENVSNLQQFQSFKTWLNNGIKSAAKGEASGKDVWKSATSDIPDLDEVEGIGEVRARTIKQSLKRMQEQFVFDNIPS